MEKQTKVATLDEYIEHGDRSRRIAYLDAVNILHEMLNERAVIFVEGGKWDFEAEFEKRLEQTG